MRRGFSNFLRCGLLLKPAEFTEAEKKFGRPFPEDYKSFMMEVGSCRGKLAVKFFLWVWSLEEVVKYNEELGVEERAPGLVLFGDDNVSEGFGFDTRDGSTRIVMVPFSAISHENAREVGKSFDKFLARMARGRVFRPVGADGKNQFPFDGVLPGRSPKPKRRLKDPRLPEFVPNGQGDLRSLAKVEKSFGHRFPADYRSFMKASDGGTGSVGENFLVLWRVEELVEYNNDYEVEEGAPGLVLFGGDGANELYGFDTRQESMPVVIVPGIGMSLEDAEPVADSFDGFLSKLAREGPFDGSDG